MDYFERLQLILIYSHIDFHLEEGFAAVFVEDQAAIQSTIRPTGEIVLIIDWLRHANTSYS